MKYVTFFELEAPVIDFTEAYEYLTEDDMTKYLKNSVEFADAIDNIEWILETEQSGRIVLDTNRALTVEELDTVSDWVSGQNSDGLGEGFEQQYFANYNVSDDHYDEYEDDYEEDWVMASFDWQTNDYKFEEE